MLKVVPSVQEASVSSAADQVWGQRGLVSSSSITASMSTAASSTIRS